MTSWSPQLLSTESKYQGLVEALQRDVESGALAQGARLPTQRELADRLGMAIGTVSRAYAVAERRGLISGEVGRGTFVRRRDIEVVEGADQADDPDLIDLSRGRLVRDPRDPTLAHSLSDLSRRLDVNRLVDIYQPPAGMARHREAGAAWVGRARLRVEPTGVVVTSGAQHGAALVLSSICRPGDLVLTEELTYPGIMALASLLRLELRGLPMDDQGLRPDALETACRSSSPRALFCMSTLQNPTGLTMPVSRRREIAAIAESQGIAILEDDVNGFVPAEPLPPIAAFAPARTFYITGTSKSLAPGLRIGYVVPPADRLDALITAIQATTWFTAPLMAELASEWIENGEADAMAAWKRAEIGARHAVAMEILGPWVRRKEPVSFHIWLSLPEPWRSETFAVQARSRGVLVNSSEEFLVGRESTPRAIRVCLGASLNRVRLKEGLLRLGDLLSTMPKASPMVY